MPAIQFKKAQKAQSKLRLAIAGPAGSGKTYTALSIASELGEKVAVIDTERGSAALYSDRFHFDVLELDDFHPNNFIEAIKAAEKAGYDVIVIDSTTHEWNGRNGILELHEAEVSRQKTKNTYTAWAAVTPLHTAFIDAILQSKCHVIASVRSKVDYIQEKNERGYTEIRKVGMASIQKEGTDYEYSVMLEMDLAHNGVITKTRCAELDNKVFKKPGAELAEILKAWLSDGAPAEQSKPDLKIVPPTAAPVTQLPAAALNPDSSHAHAIMELKQVAKDAGYKKPSDIIPHIAKLLECEECQGSRFTEWLQSKPLSDLQRVIDSLKAKIETETHEAETLESVEQDHDALVKQQLESAPEMTPHEALAAARKEWLRLGGKEHTILREMDKRFKVGIYAELSNEQASELLQTVQKWLLDLDVS